MAEPLAGTKSLNRSRHAYLTAHALAMENFETYRRDIDTKQPPKICCCCFDSNKWNLLWYWLTAKRAFQTGNWEYRIPVPTNEPKDFDLEQLYRQQTSFWGTAGASPSDYPVDLDRSKNREATIQSHGKLSFDQYKLIAHKVQNRQLGIPISLI
eukprot:Gregarina_sp_Poly_1__11107@NODE_897_length_5808_cov_21_397318_g641_i0_p6_GENE_NODE_897_length_5808_cov_21_397318_g641_i0NODE_897_length_5808_cov_21_397318_g641_i0_p6_ORF_typecomplete_len154_score12_71_NODE_897_length_5808_cov_21_397318_g641_i041214582